MVEWLRYLSGDDPVKQAENFLRSLPKLKTWDISPILDLEQGGWTAGADVATFQANVKIWLKIVEEKLGMKPIIYTNNPFAKSYLQGDDFNQNDLWLAGSSGDTLLNSANLANKINLIQ